ncbi:Replication protein A 70 kDa DNA-binding subunit B [Abeliophyllum distichum]|uniref:Replication protein A 70 kDa DNA-binding subunit B n=1 Tax=Abeliophyllum distichum TaxID=126358 RepID=A0ABD1U3E7_9LAMI
MRKRMLENLEDQASRSFKRVGQPYGGRLMLEIPVVINCDLDEHLLPIVNNQTETINGDAPLYNVVKNLLQLCANVNAYRPGNEVHSTIYENNISAFQDLLSVGKTYLISNATVKPTRPDFQNAFGKIQWTITGKTRIELIDEDNSEKLKCKYNFTPFHKLEAFMDANIDIDIIGIILDIKSKRFIRTRKGKECFVQDLVLINERSETVFLTMWDTFVDKECIYIHSRITKRPIIIGKHVRVSSYHGLSINSKANSCFTFDGPFDEYYSLKTWASENEEKLSQIVTAQLCATLSPSKASVPQDDKITSIKDFSNFFWVKGTATVIRNREPFWYMACQNCNRQSNGDYGEIYFCLFCKSPQARAIPRARASVKLQDQTGTLHASIIGSPAEIFLACSANQLMECVDNLHKVRMSIDTDQVFYLMAAPKNAETSTYTYEIILMMENNVNHMEPIYTHTTMEEIQHHDIDKIASTVYENPMQKEILGESSNNTSIMQVKRELANASGKQSTKKRANDNFPTDTADKAYESDETPLHSDYVSF